MYFRPQLVPTLCLLPLLAIAMGLSLWQVERLGCKENLLTKIETNLAAPPLTLDQVQALPESAAQYRRVRVHGTYRHDQENYAFATGEGGQPEYHVLTPLILPDGRALIVDRGIIPIALRDPETRPAGQITGPQTVMGVWRKPDPANSFSPAPDYKNRIWYVRDVSAMAARAGLRLTAPVVLEADAAANPGGWPKGGKTVISIPNNHLSYAVTWFLLGLGLIGVYFVFHVQRGRLGLGRFDEKCKK